MALTSFFSGRTKIDFVKLSKFSYILSSTILIIMMISLVTRGLNYGIDFQGGFLIEARSSTPIDLNQMRNKLSNLRIGDVKLQQYDQSNDVVIRVENQHGGEHAQSLALSRIKESLGPDITYRKVETVGPKVTQDLKRNAMLSVVCALLAMLIYIWFRFEWAFGVCAIVCLAQNCFSILGLYTLFGLEFNETAIIAILTTAGYTINDTVVIYDRIRENLRKYRNESDSVLINNSINQTLTRTILTSFTTLLSLIALYLFGGHIIQSFTLPIISGISFGTFSSIFLAAPMLLFFDIRSSNVMLSQSS